MGRATGRGTELSALDALRAMSDMGASALRGATTTTLGTPGDLAEMGVNANLGITPGLQALGAMVRPAARALSGLLPTSEQVSAALPPGPDTPYEALGRFLPMTPGMVGRMARPMARAVGEGLNAAMLNSEGRLANLFPAAMPRNMLERPVYSGVMKPNRGRDFLGEPFSRDEAELWGLAVDAQDAADVGRGFRTNQQLRSLGHLTPEQADLLDQSRIGFAEGGIVPSLNAWLENKRRVARKTLQGWFEDPGQSARNAASLIDESNKEGWSDPTAGLNTVTGPIGGIAGVIKPKGGQWLNRNVEERLAGLQRPVDQQFSSEAARLEGLRDQSLNSWIQGLLTRYIKRDLGTPEDPVRALAEQGILHYEPIMEVGVGPGLQLQRTDAGFPPGGMSESPLAKAWEKVADKQIMSQPAHEFAGGQELTDPWLTKVDPNTPVYYPSNFSMAGNLGLGHLTDELRNALDPASGLPAALRLRPEQMQQMGMGRAVRHVAAINDWRVAQQAEADLAKSANPATHTVKEYPETGMRWVELKTPELPEGWHEAEGRVFDPEGGYKAALSGGDPRYAQLQDALKYEGDTMGHCVGGYCEDVLSGRSRIFSLRDAKGQPHVTIETNPFSNQLGDLPKVPPRIVQIKGKGNKAPVEAYLPHVQDFVKNQGPWSSVGDIENSGLRRSADVFNPVERLHLQNKGVTPQDYLTRDEIDQLQSHFGSPTGGTEIPGFADGGLVHSIIEEYGGRPFDPQVRSVIEEHGGVYA